MALGSARLISVLVKYREMTLTLFRRATGPPSDMQTHSYISFSCRYVLVLERHRLVFHSFITISDYSSIWHGLVEDVEMRHTYRNHKVYIYISYH
jgi:hypothetical protein